MLFLVVPPPLHFTTVGGEVFPFVLGLGWEKPRDL